MSNRPPQHSSPSISPKQFDTSQSSAHCSSPKERPHRSFSSAETPQVTAGYPSLPSAAPAAETRYPFGPPAPLVLVSEPPPSPISDRSDRERAASVPGQGRLVEHQRNSYQSSSLPTTRSSTPQIPYALSATEQSTSAAMSSAASSPGNTTTSGSTSGSNPGYHLPYAPFPYPIPGGARGGQGSQGSGSSGK
ncbi:uncharacterized protein EI97DRAFT_323613 [Westerdykella ornata]|uniref:Uncharacterized protein n=1 Tax=Westerdykella ornata TaxID=318751 RepID=A0A6A6JK48_WESOR|nr:uncharacterized protein EI97DRAFT_323613 [Westerdykella ornata]KAF2276842.1 hypothetical protein EI97DRAFT_323613 [Westerdykella ornata]